MLDFRRGEVHYIRTVAFLKLGQTRLSSPTCAVLPIEFYYPSSARQNTYFWHPFDCPIEPSQASQASQTSKASQAKPANPAKQPKPASPRQPSKPRHDVVNSLVSSASSKRSTFPLQPQQRQCLQNPCLNQKKHLSGAESS